MDLPQKIKTLTILSLLLGMLFYPTPQVQAATGIPKLINFQGRLTDSNDNLLDGTYYICFSIYDAESDGNKLWPSGDPSPTTVSVSNGVFSTQVGLADTLDLDFTNDTYYLNVYVNSTNSCTTGGEDLSPRQRITAAGYAITASNLAGNGSDDIDIKNVGANLDIDVAKIDLSTQVTPIDLKDSTVNALSFETNLLSLDTSNNYVGIGTTGPAEKLEVAGNIFISGGDRTLYLDKIGNPVFISYKTDGTARMAFGVDVATSTERLVILNNGYVGIGTTNPAYRLDVTGGIRSSSSFIYSEGTGFLSNHYLSNGGMEIIADRNNNGNAGWIRFGRDAEDLDSGGVEYMRITEEGNIGIGTTGPYAKLHVLGAESSYGTSAKFERGGSEKSLWIRHTGNDRIRLATDATYLMLTTGASDSGAGTDRLVLDNSGNFNFNSGQVYIQQPTGNVGIGTSNPQSLLTVLGGNIELRETDNENSAAKLEAGASAGLLRLYGEGTENVHIHGGVNQDIWFNTGGNVGIGTTGPVGKLHVVGSSYAFLVNSSGSVGIGTTGPSVPLEINVNTENLFKVLRSGIRSWVHKINSSGSYILRDDNASGDRLTIDTSGNVGIGTTNPRYKLEVNGTTAASQFASTNASWATSIANIQTQLLPWIALHSGNVLAYRTVVSAEYWDDGTSSWTSWSTDNIKPLLTNERSTGTTIDYTHRKFRFVLSGMAWRTVGAIRLVRHYTSYNATPKITIETDADGDFSSGATTRLSETAMANDEQSVLGTSISTGDAYWRITLNYDSLGSGESFTLRMIEALGMRGTYGQSWDEFSGRDYTGGWYSPNLAVGYTTGQSNTLAVNGTGYFSGNVGIGTTGPGAKLELYDSTAPAANSLRDVLELRAGASLNDQGYSILWQGTDTWNMARIAARESTGYGGNLVFETNNANDLTTHERMRIDKDGNIGIGTTNPSYKLEVVGTGYFGDNLTIASGYDLYSYGSQTLGNRTYTEDNYVTDAQTFTASIDALDQAVADVAGGTTGLWKDAGTYIYADNTANDDVVVTDTGRIGIGTTAPGGALHIKGTDPKDFIRMEDSDTSDYFAWRITSLGELTLDVWDSSATTHYYPIYVDPSTVGNNLLYLKNGNVGIGTTGPSEKLEVAGNIYANTTDGLALGPVNNVYRIDTNGSQFRFLNSSNGYANLRAKLIALGTNPADTGSVRLPNNQSIAWRNAANSANAAFINVDSNDKLHFGIGAANKVTIDTAGNVGIGTTAPSVDLSIGEALLLDKDSNDGLISDGGTLRQGIRWDATNTMLRFQTSGDSGSSWSDVMAVTYGGNVGIGTTAPSYKLEVAGTGYFGGDLTVAGSVLPSTGSTYDLGSSSKYWSKLYVDNIYTSGSGAVGYWTRSGTNLSPSTSGDDLYLGSGELLGVGYDPSTISGGVAAFNGNVGIGTTVPSEELTIAGDVGLRSGALWQPVYPSDDGLLGYWPFSEGTGSITYDKSPYGKDGTITGATWTSGKYGNALSFDGNGDDVNVGTFSTGGSFTYELWVKYNGQSATSQWPVLLAPSNTHVYPGIRGGGNYGADVPYLEWGLYPTCDGSSYTSLKAPSETDGNWHHLAYTYDGSTVKVYFDGEYYDQKSQSGMCSGTPTFRIADEYNGVIDEVKIYNRALSEDEIRTHYLGGSQSHGYILADKFRVVGTDANVDFGVFDGNVGIGTTGPATLLHIKAPSSASSWMRLDTTDSNFGAFVDFQLAGTRKGYLGVTGTAGAHVDEAAADDLLLRVEDTNRDFFIASNTNAIARFKGNLDSVFYGNVGIGTTGPGAKLEVSPSGSTKGIRISAEDGASGRLLESFVGTDERFYFDINGDLFFSKGSDAYISNAGAGGIAIENSLYVKDNGNVGIGTTTPSTALDISGDVNALLTTSNPTKSVGTFETQYTTTANSYGTSFEAIASYSGTANSDCTITGFKGEAQQSTTYSLKGLRGFQGGVKITNTGTVTNAIALFPQFWLGSSSNITNAWMIRDQLYSNGSYTHTIENLYHLYLAKTFSASTWDITNQYGIYIGKVNRGSSNNYAIYSEGGDVYFAGNVGIGTTNPGTKLEVAGNINLGAGNQLQYGDSGAFWKIDDEGSNKIIISQDGTGGPELRITGDGSNYANAYAEIGSNIRLNSNGSSWINGGNVGIGTTDPQTKLHIYGGSAKIAGDGTDQVGLEITSGADYNAFIVLNSGQTSVARSGIWLKHNGTEQWRLSKDSNNYFEIYDDANNLQKLVLKQGTSGDAYFNNIGNLGIGTTAPGALLDVDRADTTSDSELINFRSAGFTQTISSALTNARFNQFAQPTITAATAQTVTNAATLYVAGAPVAAGSVSITNPYALWVDAGDVRFDGIIKAGSSSVSLTNSEGYFQDTLDQDANLTWNLGSYNLDLNWSGGDAFFIDGTSGNVGIGTTNPGAKLEIAKTNTPTLNLYSTSTDNAGGEIYFKSGFTSLGNPSDILASIQSRPDLGAGGRLQFYTSSKSSPYTLTEQMRIDATGNVGIGTTAPAQKLDVNGNIQIEGQYLYFNNANDAIIKNLQTNKNVIFQLADGEKHLRVGEYGQPDVIFYNDGGASNTEGLRWDASADELLFASTGTIGTSTGDLILSPSGNVGIGTTAPNYTLDINGTLNATTILTPYQHTITVAKSGGDYTTISSALAAITDNDSNNRYLIRVMPGIYDEAITMKSYVDISGSGEDATVIGGSQTTVVTAASNSMIENLTITTSSSDYVIGVDNNGGDNFIIKNVKINLTSTANGVEGLYFHNASTNNIIDNVEVVATSQGTTYGVYGIDVYEGSTAYVYNSRVSVEQTGNQYAIGLSSYSSNSILYVYNCKVEVIQSGTGGGVDAVYVDSGADLQFIFSHLNVTLNSWGYGIYFGAYGGSDSSGLITGSKITVTGSNSTYSVTGIIDYTGSGATGVTIRDSVVSATNSSGYGYGFGNASGANTKIYNSDFTGIGYGSGHIGRGGRLNGGSPYIQGSKFTGTGQSGATGQGFYIPSGASPTWAERFIPALTPTPPFLILEL